MAKSEGRRSWLAWGCFGCLGLVLVVIIIAAATAGVAVHQVRSEQVEEQVLSHETPAPPVAEQELTSETRSFEGLGEVHLELADGEFEVRPGRAGDSLLVRATYDVNTYSLEEQFTHPEGGPWSYRVQFQRTGSWLTAALKQAFGGTKPRVVVMLPVGVPHALDIYTEQAGATIELGGLWLTSADIEVSKGGFELSVSEPLREPMGRFVIHGSMGGFSTTSLGNASPSELVLAMRMGGGHLDLRGEWRQDAKIDIDVRMSGAALRLPRGVNLQGIDAGTGHTSEPPEIGRPTLTFSLTQDKRSEIEILR